MTILLSQLLGREYYQTSFGESYLLLAPLGIHITAGVIRRGLVWFRKSNLSKRSNLTKPSLLATTAYVAMAVVPVHFLVNRYYPSLDEAPIFGLSPAQLNYEYVKLGLKSWPVRTWLLYGVMVPAVFLHGAEGMIVLARKRLGLNLRMGVLNSAAALAGALLTLGGLYVVSKEPSFIYSGEAARFASAYSKSILYQ